MKCRWNVKNCWVYPLSVPAKRHNLEEALLSLEVVLQGGLGVIDRRVPQLENLSETCAKQSHRSLDDEVSLLWGKIETMFRHDFTALTA